MAQTRIQSNSVGVDRTATGYLSGTYTAADVEITLGWKPKYFKVVNVTDRVTQEWFEGMNLGDFIETAADGTRTLETDDQLVVASTGVVTIVAAGGAITDNDTVVWEARG